MRLALPVRMNHGRWLVDCPFCHSALLAEDEFLCLGCRNEAVGGSPFPVAWPDNRKNIEELLMARPEVKTRNWTPGESERDLMRENAEHGL